MSLRGHFNFKDEKKKERYKMVDMEHRRIEKLSMISIILMATSVNSFIWFFPDLLSFKDFMGYILLIPFLCGFVIFTYIIFWQIKNRTLYLKDSRLPKKRKKIERL
jgi:hypothetical protein